MYAYEAAAGVFFESGLMATQDVDILWDVRSKLQLHAADKIELGGFLAILQQADRSFEPIRKRSFRAVNRKGYMVDLLKPEPRPAHLPKNVEWGPRRPGCRRDSKSPVAGIITEIHAR